MGNSSIHGGFLMWTLNCNMWLPEGIYDRQNNSSNWRITRWGRPGRQIKRSPTEITPADLTNTSSQRPWGLVSAHCATCPTCPAVVKRAAAGTSVDRAFVTDTCATGIAPTSRLTDWSSSTIALWQQMPPWDNKYNKCFFEMHRYHIPMFSESGLCLQPKSHSWFRFKWPFGSFWGNVEHRHTGWAWPLDRYC